MNCIICQKPVHFAEKCLVGMNAFAHPMCFKCTTCKVALTPGKHTVRGDTIYCERCYASKYGPKGTSLMEMKNQK